MPANTNQKIYVAGSTGMVGSAIVRRLRTKGYKNIICRTHAELDLINQSSVNKFFLEEKPDQVYIAAAKVGGIHANSVYPADFIYENLMIQNNLIHHAFIHGVKKLLFLGSSCIYPKLTSQPINEDTLLCGKLEPTNEPYAIAKIAGIKICESYCRQYGKSHGIDYRSVMPTNLYGEGDNYHPENSHVIPALIRRFNDAKVNKIPMVKVWGTGNPRREFLYVDDMAEASILVMELEKKEYQKVTSPMNSFINIGFGSDISISDLAQIISKIVDYRGKIYFDKSKPDGSPSKLLNIEKIKSIGWKPQVDIYSGLIKTYNDFLKK